MNLYDVKEEEEWQEILDNLCEALDMPTALVDPHSFVLQESGERHDLCSAIRARKDTLMSICAQTQKFMAREAKETRRPVIVSCEANMSKCLIPIFLDDEFMGSVVVCGTALPDEKIKTAMVAEKLGMDSDDVVRMADRVPVVDRKKVAEVSDKTFNTIHSAA